MKRILGLIIPLATTAAYGQGFNIDLDLPTGNLGTGAPTNAFAAAGAQAGFWNAIGNIGTTTTLKGLNGVNSAVTVQSSGNFIYHDGNSSATGDYAKLLEDCFKLAGANDSFVFTFSNLAAGKYFVYTYGDDPADGTQHTRVTINGNALSCGGSYGTNDLYSPVAYVRHVVSVAAGQQLVVNINNNPAVGGSRGVIAGFQLVPAPSRLYVNDNAPAGGDGKTWATAFQHPADAFDAAANYGGAVEEIWVAGGTYYTRPVSILGDTFKLPSGIKFYGGFAGTETSLAQRPLFGGAGATYLSGSIGLPTVDDNAEHVVMAMNCDASTVIDGFYISGGKTVGVANGAPWDGFGAGMYISDSQLTVSNCRFVGNQGWRGGAIAVRTATPNIRDCAFFNNTADQSGGAIYTLPGGSPDVAWCDFVHNHALAFYGGAISHDEGTTLNVFNSRFYGNDANFGGGGIFTEIGNCIVTNCIFTGNTGNGDRGGAIHSFGSNCYLFVYNSTIHGNYAYECGGIDAFSGANVFVRNSIVWGNTDGSPATTSDREQLYKHSDSAMTVSYCDVQNWSGILGGTGNFGADPRFLDADGADNTPGTPDDDFRLLVTSPCIDRGSNALISADYADVDEDNNTIELVPLDLNASARRADVPSVADLGVGPAPIVDIGAYEFQPPCDIVGDLDQDGDVDLTDLATMLASFGLPSGQTRATGDVNGDGAVNLTDLAALLANYGAVCD